MPMPLGPRGPPFGLSPAEAPPPTRKMEKNQIQDTAETAGGKRALELVIKRRGKPWEAAIFDAGKEVASIDRKAVHDFLVSSADGRVWELTSSVHGERRPFSMRASRIGGPEESAFTIRDNLLQHHGRFYVLGGKPEGRPLGDLLFGRRYICRLDGFPFADLGEVDGATWSRLKRFRGPAVGELDGIGTEGHSVRLSGELEDIALPLAASSYLLYSTA